MKNDCGAVIFLKEKKSTGVRFESGSKLPLILYVLTAVILSCAVMMGTMLTSGFSFTLGRQLGQGDMNGDGELNASDALKIIMRENNQLEFNGTQLDAGDINGDGAINQLDALLIIQYSTKSSEKLGILSSVNVSMEEPLSGPRTEETENTDSDVQQPSEETFVRAGSSYLTAFLTSQDNIFSTARIVNCWKSDGKNKYQIEITVKNNSQEYIGSHSVDLEFSNNVTVENSWKCYTEENDYGIEVTTQSSSYISPGGYTKCGLIVSSKSEISLESVSESTD